ncbi:hypothetical protein EEB19_20680 [Gordonia sp. OPL2]|nr:hypothetical protein EEB19_20680 [Gordonia sp. OPL2]
MAAVYPRRTRVAVAAALLIGLAGCGADEQPDAAGSGTAQQGGCATETTSGREGVDLLAIPPAKVTLTNPGSGERKVAAAAPDRNSPQSATLVTTSSVAAVGDEQAQTVEMPLEARFHCTDSTDVEMVLGTVTSPDAELNGQLRPVAGSQAGLAIGPGSMPISLRLLPAESAGSQARLAVEQALVQSLQLSVPLPTEPIAVGATWRAERTINSAATVTQHIDATLTAWEGNRLTMDVTVDETPVNSVFVIPGSDQTLNISRFSNSGTGQVTLDLTRGLPVSARIDVDGARELFGADPAQPLIQRTSLSVGWR